MRPTIERTLRGMRRPSGICKHVVIKTIFRVPQLDTLAAEVVHRFANIDEVFEEFAGDVFVGGIFSGELERDRQHVQTVHTHPAGAVGLLDVAAGRKRFAAIEHADIVEPEKAALENVAAFGVFAIDPPGEVEQELLENPFEKFSVAGALPFLFEFVDAPCSPGVYRRVDIAERPLVGRQLAIRMHVPFARHEQQLLFGKVGVNQRERDAVKGQIPRRIPGIFPFVRHGNHIGIVKMVPVFIARVKPLPRRLRTGRVALNPAIQIVAIELLAPEQARRAPGA